jgi:hypothetical protein
VISYSNDKEALMAVKDILARSVLHVSLVIIGSPSIIVILPSATTGNTRDDVHVGHHDSS